MNAEHEGIYIAKAPAVYAGLQCYPGAAVRSGSCPGHAWEAYDPERHGAVPLVFEPLETVSKSFQSFQGVQQ